MNRNYYKRSSKLKQYKFGDWLKDEALPFVGDSYRRTADSALSLVGAGNVINEDKYKTKFFKKTDRVADTVAGVGGQVAAGILLPGIGDKVVAGLQKGVGAGVGDPVADRIAEENTMKEKRLNMVAQKNTELLSQFPYGGNLDSNNSIKGVLMEGLDDRYNSTKNKRLKKQYKTMKEYLYEQMLNDLEGKDEFEFYKNDPMLKDYISDPATLGRLKKRGFNYTEPNVNENLTILASGGFVRDYDGNTHENGGIPIDEMGNPIDRGMARQEVEDDEVEVKFPKEENPYIFSDRLQFADKAKKIQKKYSKRKGDVISENAMYEELDRLREDQEMVRAKKAKYHETQLMKYGGKLPKYAGDNITQTLNMSDNYDSAVWGDYSSAGIDLSGENKDYKGSYLPGAINIAGNVAGLISANKAMKNYGGIKTPDYQPELIDLTDAVAMTKEAGTKRFNRLKSNIRDFSPGQRAAVLSTYEDQETLDAIRDLELKEKTANTSTKNDAKIYNLNKSITTQKDKLEAEEFYRQMKMGYLNNIFNTVGSLGSQATDYDIMNSMMPNTKVSRKKGTNKPTLGKK